MPDMDSDGAMFIAVVAALLVALLAVGAILYLILSERAADYHQSRTTPASVMVILGSGGHTAEMLTLVREFGENYSPRYYVLASNDKMSEKKIRHLEQDRAEGDKTIDATKDIQARSRIRTDSDVNTSSQRTDSDKNSKQLTTQASYSVHKIPRSREVKQSWVSTVFTTVYATLYSFPLVFKLRPEVILCNGPGTCIPLCLAGFVLKLFTPVRIVYVESVCRVETLSLSGRILYHLADAMFVQWKPLQQKYPKTKYIGRLV